MKRMQMIGLALVAVFAMSAVAVSSASAAPPEFKFGGVKKGLTAKGGVAKLVTPNHTVECQTLEVKKVKAKSKAVMAQNTFKAVIRFFKCKLVGGGECKTAGANAEEIVTNHLKAWLFYIKEAAPKEVGAFFEPESAAFAEFECTLIIKVKVKVTGCVDSKVKPINAVVTPPAEFVLDEFPGPTKINTKAKKKPAKLKQKF